MPVEFHYLSLVLFGFILTRIFLKEKKERFKKINAYLTVVNFGILLLFNLITYYFSELYQIIFRNLHQLRSYVLIALIIFINITILLDLIKIFKKDEAEY